ncbi:hypothetical protein BT67DRAFT_440563 [Trichocladium antarcticum]|uniref:Uncharacterized protein n=1 Tax=Trichocladium antarcticum TaxID=1450529 RepID=A0AAN6ZE26_9PEZI|nr:hypothetical protein BT67DRAFT_440563 [Trichocladium antarcticum]
MTNLTPGALPPPKQIRFVNSQGQPPSKRRRINAAYVSPFSYVFVLVLVCGPRYRALATVLSSPIPVVAAQLWGSRRLNRLVRAGIPF